MNTDLPSVLLITPRRWYALVENLSDELLRRPPEPGEWSALECLQHLIDMDRDVFPQRVEAIQREEGFPAYFPEQDGTPLSDHMTGVELAAEFESLRIMNLALIEQITDEDIDKQAEHAELGPVSLRHLLNEWAAHDLMHTMQAEQALMQPFIAGCGPWQPYFSEHAATKNSRSG